MRHFAHADEISCVMYEGGDVRVAHQADESVDLVN
jgi:hypothetical protein